MNVLLLQVKCRIQGSLNFGLDKTALLVVMTFSKGCVFILFTQVQNCYIFKSIHFGLSFQNTQFYRIKGVGGSGIFSWYALTIRTKVTMIQQNYKTITGVNYRADTKRFTHRRCKNLTSCQFLDDAKNNIMSKILV